MLTYLKLAGLAVILAILGYTHFLAYNRGKDSVFKGVLAGTAISAEKHDAQETKDLETTTAVTKQLASLEARNHELTKRLKELAAANPRVECTASLDELRALQDIATGGAK